MKIFSTLSIFILIVVFIGCKKNVIDYGEIEKVSSDQALIKFDYASQYDDNRKVVLKINDIRVSYAITGRTPFPGGGFNTGGGSSPDFIPVNPGNVKVTVAQPYRVDTGLDSLILYTTNLQLQAGKNYVLHITDILTDTKSVLTEEDFIKADSGLVAYRFINLMPDVPAIDLYYGSTSTTNNSIDTLIAGNVGYLNMTSQFKLKQGQSKRWKIRPAGSAVTTATVLASYSSTNTFRNQRVFNIFASGYKNKTATQSPFVSFFLIR
jgi:hypothetical protein